MTVGQMKEQLEEYPDHLTMWVDTGAMVSDIWTTEDEKMDRKEEEYENNCYREISSIDRESYNWNDDRVTISLKDI